MRTVECYLALLTAALRTNAAMHCRAKPLLLANFTNSAAQVHSCNPLCHPARCSFTRGGRFPTEARLPLTPVKCPLWNLG